MRSIQEPGSEAMIVAPDAEESKKLGLRFVRRMWAISAGVFAFGAGTVAYALANGLPQLFRDGLDWGYDIAFYVMAAVLFGRGDRAERAGALALGTVMLVAGVHTLLDLYAKVLAPRPIEPMALGFSAISAAAYGFLVVYLLLPFRTSTNPLIEATWVSARNAMISTAAYAGVTFFARLATSRGVEYGLDVFGALLCFQAAYVIFRDALRPRPAGET